MGLFGGKQVLVASTVYNMAGGVEDRIDFLKTLVGSNVITSSQFSMSETINQGYINGPGIKIRSFHRWAKLHYTDIGVPRINFGSNNNIPVLDVKNQIPKLIGQSVIMSDFAYGPAKYSYWAERWILENQPTKIGTGWTADVDYIANTVIIHWNDGITADQVVSVTDHDFDDTLAIYAYVHYILKNSSGVIGPRLWIYKFGDGNAVMDDIPIYSSDESTFLPFIPVRIEGEWISNTYHSDMYALAKKAYKKATTQKFDKLVDKLNDNDDLGDIDHAYMMYGVALNTADNSARKYLYKFFHFCMENQNYSMDHYNDWRDELLNYNLDRMGFNDSRYAYFEANEVHYDVSDPVYGGGGPGTVIPPMYPVDDQPFNRVEFKAGGTLGVQTNMDIIIHWSAIEELTGTGLGKPGAKKGELWFETDEVLPMGAVSIQLPDSIVDYNKEDDEVVTLFWQETATSWKALRIVGMWHENRCYKTNSVDIKAQEALEDEDESGFIVPIHMDTLKSMSLVDSTQMMTSACYMIFNSYDIVKQKWYQTAIFKIVVFVAMIAITVATGGAAAPGLLGAAGSVGAALGFTGLAAVIVGAVANAIAGMLLMTLISKASTAVFGAKIGALVATIASVVAMSVGSGLMSGQSLASVWGNLMSAQNIMGMTSAVGNGVAGYVQGAAQEWAMKSKDLMDSYSKESGNLSKQWLETFGYGSFGFDPTLLTNQPLVTPESSNAFLMRTLMTGSDIANMSLDMITDFADLTLDLSTIGS